MDVGPGLVADLRRGSSAAFDEVYRLFRPRIYSFLARLTRDRSVAEDLLQETWLRLARSANSLDEDTNLGAWLFSVARNLFISRQRWRRLTLERFRMLRSPDGHEQPTPFDLASANETERELEDALGALPAAHREVLLLVCGEGFSPSDAARILGISAESARQRLARARAALGKRLDEQVARARVGARAGGDQ